MAARKLPEQVLTWENELRKAGLGHLDVRRALRQVSVTERRELLPEQIRTVLGWS